MKPSRTRKYQTNNTFSPTREIFLLLFLMGVLISVSALAKPLPPTITCSGDITVDVVAGSCSANVTVPVPTHSGVTMTNDFNGTANASGTYKVGVTFVTWTSTDGVGATATCSQRIIVRDQIAPSVTTCPPNMTGTVAAWGQCQNNVAVTPPSGLDDNCLGSALYFDGSGESINNPTYLSTVNTFTMEVWVKPDAGASITFPYGSLPITAGGQRYVIDATYPYYYWGLGHAIVGISVGDNGVRVYEHGYNSGPVKAEYIGPISTTNWTHIAVTYTNQVPRLYINGVLVATGGPSGGPFPFVHPGFNTVGSGYYGYGRYKGAADEIRIWDFAKTAAQIQADMGKEMLGTESGLVAHLNMNENAGTKVYNTAQVPHTFFGTPTWITPDAVTDYTLTNSVNGTANASGSYTVGTTPIVWTLTDKFGNITTCNQNVTVTDAQAPTISCAATVNASVAAGQCTANVTVPVPTTGDNCSVASVTNSFNGTGNASGSYPVGTTNVLWTVTDGSGNTQTCTTVVTVTDAFAPTATASDVTVTAAAGACKAFATVRLASLNDNCSALTVVNDVNGTDDASGDYPLGKSIVTWTVTDPGGNKTTVYQNVTVNDVTPSAILSTPGDQTVAAALNSCSANLTLGKPTVAECVGSALSFDGVDDYVPYTQSIGTVNNFTVEMWVKPSATITLPAESNVGFAGGVNQRYVLYPAVGSDIFGPNQACFGLSVGTNGVAVSAHQGSVLPVIMSKAVAISGWTHIAVVVTNRTPNLYVNGTFIGSGLQSAVSLHLELGYGGASPWHGKYGIGGAAAGVAPGAGYGRYIGEVDDVRVWNTTLTAAQIAANYNKELVGNEANLVSYTNFNEGAGAFAGNTLLAGGGLKSPNALLPQWVTPDPVQDYVITNSFNGTDNASGTYPVGTTPVMWTVTDRFGNTSTSTTTIVVEDKQNPTISVATPVFEAADPNTCTANVSVPVPSTADNCAVASITNNFNNSGDASGVYPVGLTKVIWTVTDIHGNVANATTNVTVADMQAPTITVSDVVTSTDLGACTASVVIPITTSDNCTVPADIQVTNTFNGTADPSGDYPIGVTAVGIRAIDKAGNETNRTITVTVQDLEAPSITCPSDIVINTGTGVCSANVTVPKPVISDNCTGTLTLTNDRNNSDDASGTYALGSHTVQWTATDAAGNTSTCSMTITVNNIDLPAISCSDITVPATAGVCEANVTIASPVVSDNCGVASVTNNRNGTSDASGVYPVGTTTVIWTVVNNQGNSNTCTQKIIVEDREAPVLASVANITVPANAGSCEASVTLTPPAATDNCSTPVVSHNGNASGVYPVGSTEVTWTATDNAGNTAQIKFNVIVIDSQLPVITPPANVHASAAATGCTGDVVVPALVATDNCGIASIVNSRTNTANASGNYPVGTTTITWTVTDQSGNVAIATQDIIVNDVTAPAITAPLDITVNADPGQCGATVNIPALVATDACGIATIVNDQNNSNNATGFYNVGTTTVTWTVTDVNGNASTESMDVIVRDIEAPQFVNPVDRVNLYVDAGRCDATTNLPQLIYNAADNCALDRIEIDGVATANANGTYPEGVNVVEVVAYDRSGNTTTHTLIVEVIDNEAPVVQPMANVTLPFDPAVCGARYTLRPPSATDCGPITYSNNVTGTRIEEHIFAPGTHTIEWTVTGNEVLETKVSFTITVQPDNIAPVIERLVDITSCNPALVIPVPGATDACGIAYLRNSFNNGTDASGTYPLGTTVVTYTAADNSGNISTMTFRVNIVQNPDVANAGPDQQTCSPEVTLAATALTSGQGTWRVISGSGTFSSLTDPNATVTGMSDGDNVFEWTVRFLGCETSDRVTVTYDDVNLVVAATPLTIKVGESVTLTATASAAGTFQWSGDRIADPANGTTLANPIVTTTYTVQYTSSGGCVLMEDVTITVEKGLLVNTAVTQNGDNRNDRWIIRGLEHYTSVDVRLYNRNGDLVFEANGYNNEDVSFNGVGNRGLYIGSKELPAGTYFYLINKNDGTRGLTGYLELIK